MNSTARVFLIIVLVATILTAQSPADDPISFAQDIRPILSEHCFACHGPDAEKREGDLRLDKADSAIESGSLVGGGILLRANYGHELSVMIPTA